MRAEVINLADRKVELESERPSLATEVLRSVRLHLRREHKEEQCLHVVDNRWIVSFSYYPVKSLFRQRPRLGCIMKILIASRI